MSGITIKIIIELSWNERKEVMGDIFILGTPDMGVPRKVCPRSWSLTPGSHLPPGTQHHQNLARAAHQGGVS